MMSDDAALPTIDLEEDAVMGREREVEAAAAAAAPVVFEDATNANSDEQIIWCNEPEDITTGSEAAVIVHTNNGNRNSVTTVKDNTGVLAADASTDSATEAPAHQGAAVEPESVDGDGAVGDGGDGDDGGGNRDAENGETEPNVKTQQQSVNSAENLSAAVRARLDDVLHSDEDQAMRADVRLIKFLREVEESQALAALNEYHSAVSETSVIIRNKPAYLMGILRKYKQGLRPSQKGADMWGSGMAVPTVTMGAGPDGLSPKIKARLDALYEKNFISEEDVDKRCLDFFRDLTEAQAELAMDEFSQSDIESIRNKSAFLMSILRKTHESAKKTAQLAPMYGGYGAGPMMGYGASFMDPHMVGHPPFADFYAGGSYARHHPPMFNAYGQPVPMPHFIAHVPLYNHHGSDALPASVQFRLDRLCATGFCKASEIDERCRKFMREVPEPVALQAIEEFSTVDRANIRKVSAYFMGVIRKHADQFHKLNEGAAGPMGPMGLGMVPPGMMPMSMPMPMPMPGYGGMKRGREYEDPYGGSKQHRPRGLGGGTTGDVFERLAAAPARVQEGVRDMIAKGLVSDCDLDDRVTNAIVQLTEEQGVAAVEEFGQVDVSRIRNKSAYLMGLLKRYRTGGPPPPGLGQERR